MSHVFLGLADHHWLLGNCWLSFGTIRFLPAEGGGRWSGPWYTHYCYGSIPICGFPKMGVPPVIIQNKNFRIESYADLGSSHFRKPPKYIYIYTYYSFFGRMNIQLHHLSWCEQKGYSTRFWSIAIYHYIILKLLIVSDNYTVLSGLMSLAISRPIVDYPSLTLWCLCQFLCFGFGLLWHGSCPSYRIGACWRYGAIFWSENMVPKSK